MTRTLSALLVAVLVFHAPPAAAQDAPADVFQAEHRGHSFSFSLEGGTLESEQRWPDVQSPRKFTYQAVIALAQTRLWLMVFDLQDKDGDWWLAEVMGFLFDPELEIQAEVTAQGYDVYLVRMPGGHGVNAQTEALLVTDKVAFRFTCYRCEENALLPLFESMLDSFETHPSLVR